jgi:hypothetical protein
MNADHASVEAALTAVQAALPRIGKPKTAKVKTKTGADYQYSYADLGTITEAVYPLLAEHGLLWTCLPGLDEGGRFILRYRLVHTSGSELSGAYPLPTQGGPQDIGSAITYARRYALTAVLGIVAADDDDALKASGRGGTTRRRSTAGGATASAPLTDAPGDDAPSRAMVTALHASLSDYGLKARSDKLVFCGGWVGRELNSSSDLTRAEVRGLLDHLRQEIEAGRGRLAEREEPAPGAPDAG